MCVYNPHLIPFALEVTMGGGRGLVMEGGGRGLVMEGGGRVIVASDMILSLSYHTHLVVGEGWISSS